MAETALMPVASADPRLWPSEIAAAKTTYDMFRALRRIANAFGYFGFFVMRSLDAGATRISQAMVLNSLNPDFLRAFDELQLLSPTHFLHSISMSLEPQIRTRATVAAQSNEGRGQALRDLLEDFDIAECICIPVQSRSGKKGVVAFVSSQEHPLSSQIYELQHLAMLAHDRLMCLQAPEQGDQGTLTDRERECISWTAAGKTSLEIAAILGISSHTVDHYLTTAGQKLDTVNRAHTVATALRRGMIA